MSKPDLKAIETIIDGNDGIHEWDRTRYSDGSECVWMENLAARNELEAMFAEQLKKELPAKP